LGQEIAVLIDQWLEETAEAMPSRWMLDHHKSLQPPPISLAYSCERREYFRARRLADHSHQRKHCVSF
jgi:hypothetical protein